MTAADAIVTAVRKKRHVFASSAQLTERLLLPLGLDCADRRAGFDHASKLACRFCARTCFTIRKGGAMSVKYIPV